MRKWLQRIRGAIGIGVTWAAGWAPVGAVTGLIAGLVLGGVPLGGIATNYAAMFGVMGFLGGTIFCTVLSITEGRHRFDQLSLPRFVAWGALGGLLLGVLAVTAGLLGPGLTMLDAVIAGASTLLGAGSAAGTLAVARAADSQVVAPGRRRCRRRGTDRGGSTPATREREMSAVSVFGVGCANKPVLKIDQRFVRRSVLSRSVLNGRLDHEHGQVPTFIAHLRDYFAAPSTSVR